jgi:hypothetical protein
MKRFSTVIIQHKPMVIEHTLLDDNGNTCLFIEWPKDNNVLAGGIMEATFYKDANGKQFEIRYHICLNKDNPQESIDKLMKLSVLK